MKVAIVSQRVDNGSDILDQLLIKWLMAAELFVYPIPNCLNHINEWLEYLQPSIIILSGGKDEKSRDKTENELLEYAYKNKRAMLGICHGMQRMGQWAGSSLKLVEGHVRTRHTLSGIITGEANSFHNYSLQECPKDFEILARSEDNEIEAIGHKFLPWEGWMWHPEREGTFLERDLLRLKKLVFGTQS